MKFNQFYIIVPQKLNQQKWKQYGNWVGGGKENRKSDGAAACDVRLRREAGDKNSTIPAGYQIKLFHQEAGNTWNKYLLFLCFFLRNTSFIRKCLTSSRLGFNKYLINLLITLWFNIYILLKRFWKILDSYDSLIW